MHFAAEFPSLHRSVRSLIRSLNRLSSKLRSVFAVLFRFLQLFTICFSLFHSQTHGTGQPLHSSTAETIAAVYMTLRLLLHEPLHFLFHSIRIRAIFIYRQTRWANFFFFSLSLNGALQCRNDKSRSYTKAKTFKHLLTHSKWIMTVSFVQVCVCVVLDCEWAPDYLCCAITFSTFTLKWLRLNWHRLFMIMTVWLGLVEASQKSHTTALMFTSLWICY